MIDQQTDPNRAAPNDLRREILEAAISGQERSKLTQQELDRQGEKLRKSVKDARLVAGQTRKASEAVNRFAEEANTSKFKQTLLCCADFCCWWSPLCNRREDRQRHELPIELSPIGTEVSDVEPDTQLNWERLREAIGRSESGAKSSWKRTLAAPLGRAHEGHQIWYQQVDASLVQLRQVAEEMSKSIDEQIKLAQMLTIYLNYGVDQVIGANQTLELAKKLI